MNEFDIRELISDEAGLDAARRQHLKEQVMHTIERDEQQDEVSNARGRRRRY